MVRLRSCSGTPSLPTPHPSHRMSEEGYVSGRRTALPRAYSSEQGVGLSVQVSSGQGQELGSSGQGSSGLGSDRSYTSSKSTSPRNASPTVRQDSRSGCCLGSILESRIAGLGSASPSRSTGLPSIQEVLLRAWRRGADPALTPCAQPAHILLPPPRGSPPTCVHHPPLNLKAGFWLPQKNVFGKPAKNRVLAFSLNLKE